MLLFLAVTFCFQFKLGTSDDSSFVFDIDAKPSERLKYEYHEKDEAAPHVRIYDSLGREIADLNVGYCVLFWSSSIGNKYYVEMNNNTKKPMDIYMRCPNPDEEVSNALANVTDKDVVAEYDYAFKKSMNDQRNHLERLKKHEQLTLRTRRRVSILVIVEILSCCGFIYYLRQRTIKLIEKRQRA